MFRKLRLSQKNGFIIKKRVCDFTMQRLLKVIEQNFDLQIRNYFIFNSKRFLERFFFIMLKILTFQTIKMLEMLNCF